MPPDRERNLEDELRDLGPRVDYPPTPDLARSVRGRLDAERPRSGGSGPALPAWAGWVVAAALVLLVAVPVFSLAVRGGMGGGAAGVAGSGGQGGGGAASSGEQVEDGPETAGELTVPSQEEMAGSTGSAPSASPGAGSAACGYPAPYVEIQPGRGAPGTRLTVRGGNFVDANSAAVRSRSCEDSGSPDARAGAGGRLTPPRRVLLAFRQGGETWRLGVVEPGRGLGLRAEVMVPSGASPGRATVAATGDGVIGDAEARFQVIAGER